MPPLDYQDGPQDTPTRHDVHSSARAQARPHDHGRLQRRTSQPLPRARRDLRRGRTPTSGGSTAGEDWGCFERRGRVRGWEWLRELSVRRFNNLYLSGSMLSARTVGSYVDALVAYDPTYIEIFPSAGRFLAEWILHQSSPPAFPSLKAVFLSSETVLEGDQERIALAFGAPTFNKYGNSEQATIIGQCEHGSMHEFEEYSFTEYLPIDDDSSPGAAEIISTTFVNRATPLIRFRTGDEVVLSSTPCACGRALRRIGSITGRQQEYLLSVSGERLWQATMAGSGNVFDGVAQFQYYQEEPGTAVVRVVPLRQLTEADAAAIVAEAEHMAGGTVRFTVQVVDEVEKTPRGKALTIVRKCTDADA